MRAKGSRRGRPRLAPDSIFCGVRLPGSLLRSVDRRARRDGVTRSEMLRRLVVAGLETKGGKH